MSALVNQKQTQMKVLLPRRWKMLHFSVCEATQAKDGTQLHPWTKLLTVLALQPWLTVCFPPLPQISPFHPRSPLCSRKQDTVNFQLLFPPPTSKWKYECGKHFVCVRVLEKRTFSPRRAPDCLTQRSQTVYIISVNQSCAPRHAHAFRLCVTKTHLRDFIKLCFFKGV